jgi:hypothetical protein
MVNYLEPLKRFVEYVLHCDAKWLGSLPVSELFPGELIRDGKVELFKLRGHREAKRAYAWVEGSQDETARFVTVLEIDPVESAEAAVWTWIFRKGAEVE